MSITYVKGDATVPIAHQSLEGRSVLNIIHICNDVDAWGKGFVLSLSARWPTLKDCYHSQSKELGTGLIVRIGEELMVYNMIAQHGLKNRDGVAPIRYDALSKALASLVLFLNTHMSRRTIYIHGPRIGTGLGGGEWTTIETILQTELCEKGYSVTIYDL